jgi:hypothetical protein
VFALFLEVVIFVVLFGGCMEDNFWWMCRGYFLFILDLARGFK